MNYGRPDWDRKGFLTEDNQEPIFVIRGQDQVGAAAVRAWAHMHRLNGGSDIVYASAMRQADAMEAWPIHKAADLPRPER